MRVKLKERRAEAPETMSFVFDLGGRHYGYRPGQFAYFNLDKLDFEDDKGKERHFTISSSPTEKGIVMFTTRLRGSGYKETLRKAPMGLELTLQPAQGDFVLPEDDSTSHVFLAGGIGITPFRSMLRGAADRGRPLKARLLYMNRSADSVIFRKELEGFGRTVDGFSLDLLVEGDEDKAKGGDRLREAAVRRVMKNAAGAHFWVSGPPAMVEAYTALLGRLGVVEGVIHAEELAGYQPEEVFRGGLPKGAAPEPRESGARAEGIAAQESGAGLSFKKDILPMFRKFEIDSMKPAGLDLSSYDQVRKAAKKIHGMLADRKMPCDKPWNGEKVARFKRWMDGGAKP
jgi:ferredoxin-NADP reductase